MRKRLWAVIAVLILSAGPVWAVSGNAGDANAGFAFVLTRAAYTDGGGRLAVEGVFVNATRYFVPGVRTLRLTVNGRDGYVAAGTLTGGGLDRLYASPGSVRAWKGSLESPTAGKDLSRLEYNVDLERIDGQEAFFMPGIKVFYEGRQIHYDIEPALADGRTLIPARQTFETMGASVSWEEQARRVTVTRGERHIEIVLGKNQMLVNGQPVALDTPARVQDGRTLIPLRAVATALDCIVNWGDADRMVVITDG